MRKLRLSISVLCVAVASAILAVPAATASTAPVNYVALGDSYSAGVGAEDYGNSGSCLRSANAYAQLWANSHHPASFSFVACSGAQIPDVASKQLGALSASTSLVTISVGGVDSGFVDVIEICSLPGEQACLNRINTAVAFMTSELPAMLDSLYAEIKQRASAARVVVLGYPKLFDANANQSSCVNLPRTLVTTTKRKALNNAGTVLDEVIHERAIAAGFTFVDAIGPFSGHELCTPDPWIRPFVIFPDYHESFHPDKDGHANAYLPALNQGTG